MEIARATPARAAKPAGQPAGNARQPDPRGFDSPVRYCGVAQTGSRNRIRIRLVFRRAIRKKQIKAKAQGGAGRPLALLPSQSQTRSEERRVGKECRSRWS